MKEKNKNSRGKKVSALLCLQLLLVFYSCSGVVSKLAGKTHFMSREFIIYYGIMIFILAVYAVVWQQIIKILPLSVAFANKAITLVWGIVWGVLFFQEQLTPGKIVGAIITIVGVIIFVTAEDTGDSRYDS